MKGRAEHKVSGGKLLRADVTYTETIEDVEIHGDFFIYPEEFLSTIEKAFIGYPTGFSREDVEQQIVQDLPDHVELVGFTPKDVVQVVQEAIPDEDE